MAEYIERGAALEKCGWYNTVNGKSICAARKDELVAIPAADVVEVKRGRWIPFKSEHAGDIQYCSSCDVGCTWRPDYCPNCGAKMDGECREG